MPSAECSCISSCIVSHSSAIDATASIVVRPATSPRANEDKKLRMYRATSRAGE